MDLNDKVTQLEDEIKILKNEVQAVLLDLRESYLNRENPFNPGAPANTVQPIIINNQPPQAPPPVAREEADNVAAEENQNSEPPEVEEAVNKQELTASVEAAHEEVTRAWRPKSEPGPQFRSEVTINGADKKADLATVAGLTQWTASSTKRLGRERVEVILDISEMMGHLSPDIKRVVVKLISLSPEEHPIGELTTRDYLTSLIELSSLLGKSNRSELALLSILSQENNHG